MVSPSDGASSDSCLKSSCSPSSTSQAPAGGMSALLVSGGETGAVLQPGAPLALSSHLLPQAQGLPASFQEGRRASDTSLTQGIVSASETYVTTVGSSKALTLVTLYHRPQSFPPAAEEKHSHQRASRIKQNQGSDEAGCCSALLQPLQPRLTGTNPV